MALKKYWEMIVDQLSSEGWSTGWVRWQERDFDGWKVDAHKEGRRHHVKAEEINVAFLELQASVRRANQG